VVAALALAVLAVPGTSATQADPVPVGALPACHPTSPDSPAVAAAGAGFGGLWLSPPVDGVQRVNLALVTGTDETPVREALRACGTEGITDIRPAAYPYSAVLAAQQRFHDRLAGDLVGRGIASHGITVDAERFVVIVVLHTDATADQEAAVRGAATAVTGESGVPVLIDPRRSGWAEPAVGTPGPPPTTTPGTPADRGATAAPPARLVAPRPLTTRASLRRAARTGVVRIAVRRPVRGTTVQLRTVGGRGTVAGRATVPARAGRAVVAVRLTAAGRRRLTGRTRVTFDVVVRAPGTAPATRRVVLR